MTSCSPLPGGKGYHSTHGVMLMVMTGLCNQHRWHTCLYIFCFLWLCLYYILLWNDFIYLSVTSDSKNLLEAAAHVVVGSVASLTNMNLNFSSHHASIQDQNMLFIDALYSCKFQESWVICVECVHGHCGSSKIQPQSHYKRPYLWFASSFAEDIDSLRMTSLTRARLPVTLLPNLSYGCGWE